MSSGTRPSLNRARFTLLLAFAATILLLPTSVAAQSPDPTLLPVATTAQVPLTAAYNALNVPSIPAGGSYLDPTTGIKIYKLTSATFPGPAASWGHDYSEGGNEVSLPYKADGITRAVLVYNWGGLQHYLLDFTPGAGVSNPRLLTGNLAPIRDIAFTFSNNPATPYYAYVYNGNSVVRFDIRTMTEAPGGGWPVTDQADWFHQAENDSFFVWMRGPNGSTIVGYEPGTSTMKTYTNANLNEPRIDRAGRYVGLSMNIPANGLVVWDWQTNTVAWSTSGDPGIPFAHNASLRGCWVVVDWNLSFPDQFAMFTPAVPNSGLLLGGPAPSAGVHGNGSWIQHPADPNDQWALFTHYGSLMPTGSTWLAPGGMVLMTPNGQRRLLAHPYNTTANYSFFSFAKFSSDGKYVLFTSDMDGSTRSDVFLAELPQTASNPVPALTSLSPATITAGAASLGLTVNGSGFVSGSTVQWNGANRTTTFVSSTQLQAAILATDVATPGTALVTVVNPAPGGGTSNSLTFTIGAAVSLAVVRAGTGSGTVTSTPIGITCGTSCSATFLSGTPVTLTATPAAGSTFTGWSGGGCAGTGACTVTLTATTTVTATFTLQTFSLTVSTAGTGSGTVSSTPAGITCGTSCSASFPSGTALTLTATPAAGSTFTGWSGGCAGTGACTATLTANITVTATFNDTTPPTVSITAPGAAATVSGTVSVTATATDNVGVVGVQFKLDGANLGAERTTSPYTVAWNTTTATNATHTLTAVARDAAGNVATSGAVTVTVANGTTISSTLSVQNVIWTNLVNVTATGNSIQKTSGSDGFEDAGATSQQQILSGDGYLEFTASETTTLRFAGLSTGNTGTGSAEIRFAIMLQSGIAEVRESGISRTNTTFVTGDVFRIAVESGVVKYYKNGGLFYTSALAPTYPLLVDSSLASLNATITNAVIAGVLSTSTVTVADTTAPVISAVMAVNASASGATITWTTNEASDSQVEYGPTTAYGSSTALNPSLVTSHSQTLSGLAPSTVYHYRVKSRDAAGNLATSGDGTFKTAAAPRSSHKKKSSWFDSIGKFFSHLF